MDYNNNGNVFNGSGAPMDDGGPPSEHQGGTGRSFSTRAPPSRHNQQQFSHGAGPPVHFQQQPYENAPPRRRNNNSYQGGAPPPLKRQKMSESESNPPTLTLSEEQKYAGGLKQLMTAIGDDLSNIHLDIHALIDNFVSDRDLEKHAQLLTDAFVASVEVFPQKSAVYANLLAEVERRHKDLDAHNANTTPAPENSHVQFAKNVFHQACIRINRALATANFVSAKIWLRFLAHCSNCALIDTEAFLSQLTALLKSCLQHDDDPAPVSQIYAEQILYIIIMMCAHLGPKCGPSNHTFSHLLSLVSSYMDSATNNTSLRNIKRTINDDAYISDPLVARFNQLKTFEEKEWQSDVGSDQHLVFPLFQEQMESYTSDHVPYSLDELTLLECCNEGNTSQFHHSVVVSRLGLFEANSAEQLFANNEFNTVPQESLLFIEDYVCDLLYICHQNVKELISRCATLFAQGSLKFRYEHVIADIIFGSMLTVPHAPYNPLLYASFTIGLMYELNEEVYAPLKRTITRYADALFELVPKMSMSTQFILVRWFSLHVANFGNRWQWSIYEPLMTQYHKKVGAKDEGDEFAATETKVEFLRLVISHLSRLNAHGLDYHMFPQVFSHILPEAPTPQFAYASPQHPLHQTAATLVRTVRESSSSTSMDDFSSETERILTYIETKQKDAIAEEERLSFFCHVFLVCFSKSLADVTQNLDRFSPVFEALSKNSGAGQTIVSSIVEIWVRCPLKIILTVQLFIQHNVIAVEDVIAWIFANRAQSFVSMDCWELIRNSMLYLMDSCLHHLEEREFIRNAPLKENTSYAKEDIPTAEELNQRNKSEWPSQPIFFVRHFNTEDERANALDQMEQQYQNGIRALHRATRTLFENIQETIEQSSTELSSKEEDFLVCLIREFLRHHPQGQHLELQNDDAPTDLMQMINEASGFFAQLSSEQELNEQRMGGKSVEMLIHESLQQGDD